MFAARTDSRQLFYTGKQVKHDYSYIGDYDCPNSTSNGPPKGPPEKNGLKSWGVTREVGGSGHPDPKVVAPLLSLTLMLRVTRIGLRN